MPAQTIKAKLVRTYDAQEPLSLSAFHKYAKNIGAKHKRKVVIATEQQEPAKDVDDDGHDDDGTGGSELLWAAEIQIGDHRIVAAFDTASFDTVINKSAYQPSAHAKNTGEKFKLDFASGQNATGTFWLDQVDIGGILLKGVAIGAASTDYLQNLGEIVALAGLGYPQYPEGPKKEYPGLLPSLFSSGQLEHSLFSFSSQDEEGSLTLGEIDEKACGHGVPVWSKVIPNAHGAWYIHAKINGIDIKAIIDTGSAAIIAPVAQAKLLYKQLPNVEAREKSGVTYAVLKSNDSDKLPDIEFQVGHESFRLSKRAILYQKDDDGRPALSITGQNSFQDNTWIIGALLLQDFVSIFDWDNHRVGFVHTAKKF